MARGAPGRGLRAGGLDDPGADALDEAGLLGQRDELARGQEAALGVLPAHERLAPVDAAVERAHDRLPVQDELVALDGAAQPRGEREALGARPGSGRAGDQIRASPRATALAS